MIKGKWVIIAVAAVALLMGLATWPLMKLRRKNEIHKTEAMIELLRSECQAYNTKHGAYPKSLRDLDPARPEPIDAWGRPFIYAPPVDIRSLGPDVNDARDDLPGVRVID